VGRRIISIALVASAMVLATVSATPTAARAETYVPISGAGSTWAQNAIEQWRKNVQTSGLPVNYAGTGSSDGRNQFRNGTVDFAVSDIPYGLTDGGVTDQAPTRGYTYIPVVGGGTSFMYNLTIGGKRVTALRLSGDTIAKIFTRGITSWTDPQVAAENPGLKLPDIPVIPVVRGDGAGSTAQLTAWLATRHTAVWDAHCVAAGRTLTGGHCGTTSVFPTTTGYVAQAGSLGVSGYVTQSQNVGTITYVESSYAINTGFPVAKVLNAAGYYVAPTSSNVGVALLDATVRTDVPESDPAYGTADLSGVYASTDPRAYPLSGYSYLIAPTAVEGTFTTEKGTALGAFAYYALCEGQDFANRLGYVALPSGVVTHGLGQVTRIPGVDAATVTLAGCANPTLSGGDDVLTATAPMPAGCDRSGPLQCGTTRALLPAPAVRASSSGLSLSSAMPVSWKAPAGYGVTAYDLRWKTALLTGAWTTRTKITGATATTFAVRPGTTLCVSVRSRLGGGVTGVWSTYRCQARPADDRALAGSGWLRAKRAGAYLATVTRSTTQGLALTVKVTGSRLYVVATRCPTCGKVRVTSGGTTIATLDLRSSRTTLRSMIALRTLPLATRTLTLTVVSTGKLVEIDGLGVRRA
jgi:phosphate ABC transporter phosphate-binding protein